MNFLRSSSVVNGMFTFSTYHLLMEESSFFVNDAFVTPEFFRGSFLRFHHLFLII